MREQLLGYLLGALEPDEQRAVEARLMDDPQLRAELAALREKLLPLAEEEEQAEPVPPCGLAAKTCRYVMSRRGPGAGQFASAPQWRFQDVAVAGGIFVAVMCLVFPAVLTSRDHAQWRACQTNLVTLGRALHEYSDLHDRSFPTVPIDGNLSVAGMYAPTLMDCRLISTSDVVCPASVLAKDAEFRIPTLIDIERARGDALRRMQLSMGGSYGYALGYVLDGKYHRRRNLGRATFALMADAPDGASGSLNHGGRGQNVLFEDGHVRCLKTCRVVEVGDHIFENGLGYVGVGVDADDAVIVSSGTAPIVLHVKLEH